MGVRPSPPGTGAFFFLGAIVGLSPFDWLLFLLAACAGFAYAAWHYLRREERRSLAWLLVLLRGGALAGAVFLLFDPSLPIAARSVPERSALLLDGSLSMTRPAQGATLWSAALDAVRGADADVWIFGGRVPRLLPADSLPAAPPFSASLLAPAVRAAAEAGHRSARVITDGELVDAAEAMELARRYGIDLGFLRLDAGYPRVGLAQVTAPAWAELGDTLQVRVLVAARAEAGTPVGVVVRASSGRALERAEVEVPTAGRLGEARLRFAVGSPAGLQRFEVALEDPLGDEERRDDRRAIYVDVSGPPASPVVLALEPSWETTFLLPNLSRVGEAPAMGFTRVRPDRWVTMGKGFRPVQPAEITRRGAATPLLVVVGYGPGAPSWVRGWVRNAPSVWIFPSGPAFDLSRWGVRVGPVEEGEWYADATLPPSPLTGVLAGIDVALFPPLTGVRAVEGPGAWTPLRLRRWRRGEPRPGLVAGVTGRRRWAVAAGLPYWRWGFRPGAPRHLYRGLMTGLAGWLMEDRAGGEARILPLARVVPRSTPIRFLLPAASDSSHLALRDSTGALVWEARVTSPAEAGDTLSSAPLPIGRYRFDAHAWKETRTVAAGAGPVEVEPFHPELLPTFVIDSGVASLDASADRPEEGPAARAEARLPLRRQGWPILLLLALLCTEWVIRQRLGLR